MSTELVRLSNGDMPTRWELESRLSTRRDETTPSAFLTEVAEELYALLLQVAQLKRQVMLEERDLVLKALRAERDALKTKVEQDAYKISLVHMRGREAFFWLGDEHDKRWQGDRAVIMPAGSFRENMNELEELRAFKAQVLAGTVVQATPFKEALGCNAEPQPEPPSELTGLTGEEVLAQGKALGLEPIPDYGDHMPRDEFRRAVAEGFFTPDDGHGEGATSLGVLPLPSRVSATLASVDALPPHVTHVVWYNK